ncbi:glucosyltransferase domain-containing protein [Bordetella bronchialis]|uniref:Glycosyltransferase RgtA/B/C/D-like domain-containing protein n=1 Tax=Bordetella bronchialis TaxID=463025 RepID=A0A193G395_9BORD|nr:glucosyltransferase domain-containing protein [Bordetella bronchialis]ANN74320.1 hypothetical protein BAU08_25820 [Bordetella bronchialis]
MQSPASSPPRQKVFIAALLLYGLVIYPIIHADRFYIDDLGRARTGYLGWTSDGRPLSNLVVETLNLGAPISDLSPLPQLLALLLLAYLAVTLARKFGIPGTWRAPLILAPMVASPFFLENLSYKFDVLPMTLATALSCLAVTAIPRVRWGALLGAVALLATLCLYQPALNVFLVFAVAEFVLAQRDLRPMRELAAMLGMRGLQLLCALAAYKAVVAVTVKGHYATAHGAIASAGDLASIAQRNLAGFWRYVVDMLPGLWAKPLLWFMAGGTLVALYWAVRYLARSWRAASMPGRIAMAAAIALLPVALLIAPWGPMLALRLPVYAPRVAIGFGALGAAGLLFVWTALDRLRLAPRWQVAGFAVPVYGLLTFCFVYGDSLKLQKEFENRVAAQVSADLSRLGAQHRITEYALQGSLGHSVVVRHTIRKYPLIATLVPVHLTEGWGWAYEELRLFGVDTAHEASAPRAAPQTQAVSVARDYRVFLDGDIAIVSFAPAS